jgi:hypothetical protein
LQIVHQTLSGGSGRGNGATATANADDDADWLVPQLASATAAYIWAVANFPSNAPHSTEFIAHANAALERLSLLVGI